MEFYRFKEAKICLKGSGPAILFHPDQQQTDFKERGGSELDEGSLFFSKTGRALT